MTGDDNAAGQTPQIESDALNAPGVSPGIPPVANAGAGDTTADHTEPAGWRRWLSPVLLAVFLVSTTLAVPAIWFDNLIMESDRFVRTVAPLASDEAIQDAIVREVSGHVSARLAEADAFQGSDADSGIVRSTLTVATAGALDDIVGRVVRSAQFESLWEEIATVAHSAINTLITGGSSPYLTTDNGQVAFSLAPIVTTIEGELATLGITVPLDPDDAQIVLFESEELAEVQRIVEFVDALAVILPILALISLVGYVVLATENRTALVHAGFGLAAAMILLLVLVALERWWYLRNLSDGVDKDAAAAIYDVLTHYLRRGIRILALLGLITAGAAMLLIRGGSPRLTDAKGRFAIEHQSLTERWPVLARVEGEIRANQWVVVGGLAGLVVVLIIVWEGISLAWMLGLLALVAGGYLLVNRWIAQREELPIARSMTLLEPEFAPADAPAQTTSQAVAVPLSVPEVVEFLSTLGQLKAQDLLSDEEFSQAKAMVLNEASS